MASFSTRINEMRKKKNFIAKDLMTTKYKTRIVKPKKGKGSFKRKKK
jgi:alternative ribosome-rescue factor